QPLFERYGITPKDVLLVASTSGINAVPVEMALCGKAVGVPVIAIVSQAYAEDPSRHQSGKKLFDCADIVLDNGICHGDAAVEVGNSGVRVGPISTLSSCMIAQCIMTQAAENLWQRGVTPPVYVSGNLHGGMARNQTLIQTYSQRIKHL
ncbi:MAG: sugar isomerase domain-containing protein, partial [Clostridia bacterium]